MGRRDKGENYQEFKVTIPSGDHGSLDATLYLPKGTGPFPALLLNDGIAPAPQYIQRQSSKLLTGRDIAVLIPEYEGPKHHRLMPEDTEHVVHAFQFLQDHPMTESDKTRMLGFSYGGLLSLIGAADPRIRDRVPTVITASAPTDLETLITYSQSDKHAKRHIKRVVKNTLFDGIKERASSGSNTYKDLFIASEIMDTTNAFDVVRLLDEFSDTVKGDIQKLSPTSTAGDIEANVLLIHGKRDKYVPYEQAEIMHQTLLDAGKSSKLVGIDGLGHLLAVQHFWEVLGYVRKKGSDFKEHLKEVLGK